MLKYALMAIAAALVIAVAFVMLPIGTGTRQPPRLLATTDAQAPTSFTVRDAAPPAPAPAATASAPGDLDAVMQRLRNGAAAPATVAGQAAATPPAPAATPAPAPAATPQTAAADPATATPPPNPPSPPNRWGSVTGQGTRWRMARSGTGYTVSIDLGGGQVADVHVLPAFANLDPSAVNTRVDYLRDTILQNFSNQSGAYTFARDGSVSAER